MSLIKAYLLLMYILSLIPNKTPNIVKRLFSDYTWDFYAESQKKIYFTFDDGPIPDVTEFVLEQLKEYNAKATFFCIGDNIRKHPDIFAKILSEGHAIGNHTMNHIKAWGSNSKTYIDNTNACNHIILKHANTYTTQLLFRPPYGQISLSKFKLLIKLGYKIILWDVLSKDWDKTVSPEQCLQNVIQNTVQGSIIVFHDSIKASKNLRFMLPKALAYFKEQGFLLDKIEY